MTASTLSPTVVHACTFCGGGPDGFLKRPGPANHANWCPTHSPRLHSVFAASKIGRHKPSSASTRTRAIRRARVAELHADGMSGNAISRLLGIAHDTVQFDLIALGIKARPDA